MFLMVLQKVHLPFMNIHSLMNGAKMALITGTLPHVNIKMKRKTMKNIFLENGKLLKKQKKVFQVLNIKNVLNADIK